MAWIVTSCKVKPIVAAKALPNTTFACLFLVSAAACTSDIPMENEPETTFTAPSVLSTIALVYVKNGRVLFQALMAVIASLRLPA